MRGMRHLLIFWLFEKIHQIFSAIFAVVFKIGRELTVVWRKRKQARIGKDDRYAVLLQIDWALLHFAGRGNNHSC